MSCKASSLAISARLVLLSAISPSVSQSNSFDPELELAVVSNDNIFYLPEGEELSDDSLRLRLVLPLLREWGNGRLSLSYQPSYEKFSDYDALDHDAHQIDFSVNSTPNQRSQIDYSLSFDSSQRQGGAESIASPDLILVQRLDRQLLETDFSFTRDAGRRMNWVLAAGVSDYHYSAITGVDDPFETEDRRAYRGSAGMNWTQSRTATIGFEAGYEMFDLEETGEENIALLSVVWTREFARGSEVELRLGGYDRDRDVTLAPGEEAPDLDESGMQGQLRVVKTMRKTNLSFIALREPSSGGTLTGTSTDTAAQLIIEGDPRPRWHWSVSGRYSKRDPATADFSDITIKVAAAGLEWRPNRHLDFRMALDSIDQSASGVAPDLSVFTARVGVVWYPKGQR